MRVPVSWCVDGQSREGDGNQAERGQWRKDGGDGNSGGQDHAGDPPGRELGAGGDVQVPGLCGDVEQRSAAEEEPDGE